MGVLRRVTGFGLLGLVILASCGLAFGDQPELASQRISAAHKQQYADLAVTWMQDYLRIDTTNPPGNEMKAISFFKKILDQEGIENRVFEYAPGRGRSLGAPSAYHSEAEAPHRPAQPHGRSHQRSVALESASFRWRDQRRVHLGTRRAGHEGRRTRPTRRHGDAEAGESSAGPGRDLSGRLRRRGGGYRDGLVHRPPAGLAGKRRVPDQ